MSALEIGGPASTSPAPSTRVFNTQGRSLRGFAARGMLINTGFDIGLALLSLSRGFLIAGLLTPSDYGVWGVLAVTLGVLSRLKVVGVGDKYMQQDDEDQELAFQQAFTMEVLVTLVAVIPLTLALPIIGLVYGHWNAIPPGAVLMLALLAGPFSSSLWVYYRKMDFASARLLQSLDPVLGFVATLGLAIAGAGYWSLVAGVVVGAWASAIGCTLKAPYPYRWRFERGVMKLYADYSVPLLVTSATSIVLANAASLSINAKLGLAGIGVVALSSNITGFSTNVDDIVSGTLYPAICAVQTRVDLLRESFEKANRLALMWAMPFGVGIALFCRDLIHYGLGDRWLRATLLLQVTGVVVAVGHIGFNWDDYFRARADTKPIRNTAVAAAVSFVVVGVPLTLTDGLQGLGFGIGFQALATMVYRAYYLKKLFPGFKFMRHAVRACVTVAPATALILLLNTVMTGKRTLPIAIGELAVFLGVTAATTWVVEGSLLREAMGYMLERRQPTAA